ncbi:hypothetical protein [Candidatus Magnetominusculus dajiuhuensis]|uniref:hypothetical protein n=1 Tax=Candidatus Magnetominusculus dajiuhuensis TaxID=3137712 RepID=UPI003B4309B5
MRLGENMDYDTLRIEYRVVKDDTSSKKHMVPSLWINNECLTDGFTLDMRGLVASVKGNGQYDILTCSCGEPICAGISEGIIVLHHRDYEAKFVRWLIPHPIRDDSIVSV